MKTLELYFCLKLKSHWQDTVESVALVTRSILSIQSPLSQKRQLFSSFHMILLLSSCSVLDFAERTLMVQMIVCLVSMSVVDFFS